MRLALLFLPVLLFLCCGSPENTIQPEYKSLTEAVYASGTIQPDNEYQVFAPIGGILRQRLVQEGETVSEGQLLFTITQEANDLRLESATQQLATARRNASENSALLSELRLALESAWQQYVNDSTSYQRYQNLMKQNATTQVNLDNARLRFIASKNGYLAARRTLDQREDDLQDRLTEARITYQIAAKAQGDALVRSRINGTVYNIVPEPGEMVNMNQPLARVGNDSLLTLQLLVDERDIAKIQVEQIVNFTTDILPDTILTAEVSLIHPYLRQADRSFTVEAFIPPTELPLYPGSTVEANIIIQHKESALVIPKTVLVGRDSVWINHDGERQRVKIKIGVENMEMAEVVDGLTEESQIYLP
ncbi:MAG: efflux RND transporter periplasmic adaptor subunit [Cyclobacteriaceae bacterium]